MATIVTRAGKGSALTWTEGDANITNLNNDKIENIVEDTTPQLGGNLDVNGNSIVSTSNANIAISPDGTGKVVVNKELEANLLRSTQSSGDEGGQLNLALAATNTTLSGEVAIDIHQNKLRIFETSGSNRGVYIDLSTASTGVGSNLLAGGGGDVVNDTTPQLGGNLDVNGYAIVSANNGHIDVTPNGSGNIRLTPTSGHIVLGAVDFPTSTPTTGQVLYAVNSGGQLGWTTPASGGDVVNDTTPQLGGNLDVNGNAIVSVSNGNIRFEPNGTGNIMLTPSTGQIILGSTNYPTSMPNSGDVLTAGAGGQLSWAAVSGGYPQITDDTSTNATRYILFDDATSGNASSVGVSSTKLTYNPSTGVLTSTSFSGSLSGNASSASYSSAVTLTADNSTNATNYPLFSANATGNESPRTDTGFTYNPSTGILTSTAFAGALNGTVGVTTPNSGKFTSLEFKNPLEPVFDLGTTGGTIAPNCANGSVQKITLNAALTINAFTSPVAGQSLTLIIYGGTAYTSITSTMKFAGGIKTLTATAGCIDILTVYYDGTTYFASLGKGYA